MFVECRKGTGLSIIWGSVCCEDHFAWLVPWKQFFFSSTMNWVSLSAHGLSIVQAQDELFECRRGRQCIYYQ